MSKCCLTSSTPNYSFKIDRSFLFKNYYFYAFLLYKPRTKSEQTWPPSVRLRDFTDIWYLVLIAEIRSWRVAYESFIGPTYHLSHKFVVRFQWILIFSTSPGYPNWIRGTAKLINVFLIYSSLQFLTYFMSQMVWRAAMQLVVVDRAGVMRPAFNFTVIQSIF